MRASITLTAIACVLGLAGTASATRLASPAIYGAVTQKQAACTIGNTGSTPVNLTVHIVDEVGTVVDTATSCRGSVEAGFICQVFANNLGFGSAYACTADIAGSASRIRASLTLRDADETPLRAVDLR
jgi:hypothetical protein